MTKLDTRWTEDARQGRTWQEYPRPTMMRKCWFNLNGLWDYIITDKRILPSQFYETQDFPFDGKIRVPFSPEAPLSGVGRQVMPDETLWYSREILLPADAFDRERERLLLHFGAVDQCCTVYINGKHAGFHKGGYLPFSLDVSRFVLHGRTLRILVSVRDFSDTSYHARGKQKLEAGGMFYTAQSGIWQTVWLEAVPRHYIESIRITPDFKSRSVRLRINVSGQKNQDRQETASVRIPFSRGHADSPPPSGILCKVYPPTLLGPEGVNPDCCVHPIARAKLTPGQEISLRIPTACQRAWTPETPWLYPVQLRFGEDEVYTYFALRSCEVRTDKKGTLRFFLNGRRYFQAGVLDQGYWPDGLYTAPGDDALIYDIRTMKNLGFNMLRKHAKIEPERWYFHCDRMGMLIWQDMVNGGGTYQHWFVTYLANLFSWLHIPVKDRHRALLSRKEHEGRQEYIDEVRATVKALYNHPSIVTWVAFNEGWGQFSTKKVTELLHSLDPDRLVDSASGWFDQGCGDIKSLHYYFFTLRVPKSSRVLALSEFGGYSWRIPGHSACKRVYGFRIFQSRQKLTEGYECLMAADILPSVKEGVSATVYTQVSDIEEEVNGLLTYDREEVKINPLIIQKWNAKLKKGM